MQQTEFTDERGRQVIHREWHNTYGQRHRTTGPAREDWTVLPDGTHVLSCQGWYVNGKLHREGRPAWRIWHIADDGTRVLAVEVWWRGGMEHRVGGPSYRSWTVQPDGTRTLSWEYWRTNRKLHRVDGPAYAGYMFYWHDRQVTQEDLPWLRRGHCLLAGLTGATQQGGGGVSPAWSRDPRVEMTGAGAASGTPSTYRSAVGGSVLLYV